METLTDQEANMSAFQPAAQDSAPARASLFRNVQSKERLVYAIRFTLGTGVIVLWSVLALQLVWTDWTTTQATATQVTQQTPSTTENFLTMARLARTYCPPQANVLMLNNGSAASN